MIDLTPSSGPFDGEQGLGAAAAQGRFSPEEALAIYAGLVENTPDLVAVVDRNYVYRLVNSRFAERRGTTVAQIVGRPARDVLGVTVFEAEVRPYLDRCLAGEHVQYEGWFDYPTVGRRYMEVRYFPLQKKPPIEHVVAQIRDNTERKLAEEALKASEARFRLITDAMIESTHAKLALLDRDMNFVHVNTAYAQASGHPREALIGRNHFALFPNADNEVIFTRVRDTGEPYVASEKPFEFVDQPERGVTYWNWSLVPIKDHQGKVEWLLLSLLDVTPQVQARQRIEQLAREAQRQSAQLAALLASIHDGVSVLDRNGNVILRNEAVRRITGVPDALATSVARYRGLRLRYLDGSPVPRQRWPMSKVAAGEEFVGEEYILERADGSRRRVLMSGSVVRDEHGAVALGIVITRDVTELRHLEETRHDFVRAVSHDLRQPLTVMQGQAQLLKLVLEREGVDERKRRSLDAMVASARRMAQMISDMVEATRLETGQVPLHPDVLDLHAHAMEFVGRLNAVTGGRVQVEAPETVPLVLADADRLERVLGNLIDNALQYSPADSKVTVSFARGDRVVITAVRDRGCGIPAVALPHIFERYFRLHEARESRSDGLGLGLYITRLIVEAHGGQIWAESEVGRGSTFYFSLPQATENAP